MTDRLFVLMGEERRGTLMRGNDRRLTFEYDEDHRATPDATPLVDMRAIPFDPYALDSFFHDAGSPVSS